MKLITKYLFLVFSLLLFSTFARSEITDSQIYQLMDKSGLTRAIESLPVQMQAVGQQIGLTAKDPADHQQFMKIFVGSVNTDEMLQTISKYLANNISAEELNKVLTWLETDLANRVITAELQATEPDFQQNFLKYIADLQANPPSQERTAAIVNYVNSSALVEQSVKIIESVVINMFEALKSKQPDNKEMAAQLDSQLEQMKQTMRPALEQQLIMSSYFIYHNLSNAELNEYSDFYQQTIGKKYLSVVMGAMTESMNKWGATFVKSLEEMDL